MSGPTDVVYFPFDPQAPHFSQRVELDGRRYDCRVTYNQRADRYDLDLTLEGGEVLALGVRLVPGRPLLRRYLYRDSHPGGELFLVSLDATNDSAPGLGEIGDGRRCQLAYFPQALLAANQ